MHKRQAQTMDATSRYQVIPGANPLPWFSGCPIQLQSVRLVQDRLADRVLLQLLALNVTDQPIKSVCLHIVCRDAAGTMLQDYPSVLLKNIHASAHCTFRNDQNIPLASRTVYADIIPERVFFHDGQVWNRPDYLQGQFLPSPTPLDPRDPKAPQMTQEAQLAGLSSQYYYEEHNDFWYCSCGQANPIAAQSCGRCCALRRWLQANMRRTPPAVRKSPRPDLRPDLQDYFGRSPGQYQPMLPVTPPPAPAPEQLVVDPHTGELISLEKYNSLMRAMYYRKNEDMQEPPEPSSGKAKPWIVVLIIVLLLALAAAGTVLVLPQTQYGQYREAMSLLEAGDFEEACDAFTELGDYKESEENASFCRYRMAQDLYTTGSYAEACAIYETLLTYRNSAVLAADCQYRLAMDAMDEGRYEDAITCLEQSVALDSANTLYPDKLLQCRYELGFAAEEVGDYASAISWYEQCGTYADAQQRLMNCQQMLNYTDDYTRDDEEDAPPAPVTPQNNNTAASGKSEEEMYAYVSTHKNREDRTTFEYLQVLCKANYRDSQSIYNELYAWKVDMFFNSSASDLTTRLDTAAANQTLYIHYIVSGGPLDGELSMQYVYKKPNGATGEKVLSGTCTAGSTGNIFWRGGIYSDTEEHTAGTMSVSYYDAQTNQLLATASIAITLPQGQGN